MPLPPPVMTMRWPANAPGRKTERYCMGRPLCLPTILSRPVRQESAPGPNGREGMILHSPFYDSAHEAFRDQVRRFVRTQIEPHVDEWDEAGTFPRELYRKA